MTFSELYKAFDEWYDEVLYVEIAGVNIPARYMKADEVNLIYSDLNVINFSINSVLLHI